MTRYLMYFGMILVIGHIMGFVRNNDRATGEIISARRVGPCHIEQAGAYHALAEIAEKANVPIGVEAVRPEKEPTIMLDFPGGTVADLLNAFVSQAPDYTWSEAEKIIHVSRRKGHIALLDVVVSYPGADGETRKQIWEDITKRSEVAAWMNSAHCDRGELFHGGEFRNHNSPISIPSGDLTVEQLLDEVAVKSGNNYWAVLQSPLNNPCRVAIILW